MKKKKKRKRRKKGGRKRKPEEFISPVKSYFRRKAPGTEMQRRSRACWSWSGYTGWTNSLEQPAVVPVITCHVLLRSAISFTCVHLCVDAFCALMKRYPLYSTCSIVLVALRMVIDLIYFQVVSVLRFRDQRIPFRNR